MQELIREYHRDKGPVRCALKIDIQKEVLLAMHFLDVMVNWIMTCMSTLYYFISLNGYLEGFFKRGMGLRQGDPLSPYLFLLVMQVFSYILERYTLHEEFIFHPNCQEIRISHLIFANDLFILYGASSGSLTLIKQALDEFT